MFLLVENVRHHAGAVEHPLLHAVPPVETLEFNNVHEWNLLARSVRPGQTPMIVKDIGMTQYHVTDSAMVVALLIQHPAVVNLAILEHPVKHASIHIFPVCIIYICTSC